ncbi:hypothetical protein [Reinekea blandensis]|uniref:Uncharacterized protein n=1 Tax=Reinekea blandensis MED297 TaxID=314283 RepID=A4BJX8_9GAMM|nr:hypothetical protein [Reinekea blandensis]EAR07579.1 hypothetical protein MED297_00120 [Reinekea sp. MED297] [Reinekea blandensis MED297]
MFKTSKAIIVGFALLATLTSADPLDQKRTGVDGEATVENLTEFFKPKELSPFTSMRIKVMPDRGTRLIFPFSLTDENLKPTLNIFNANSSVFKVTEDEERITGQPVLDIEYVEEPAEIQRRFKEEGGFRPILGQIQISIGGYYIAIELESTLKPNDVVPNYVFQLSEEKREHLIDLAVDRHKQALDMEYKARFDALDEEAEKRTIKYVADLIAQDPETKWIKVEEESADQQISLYVERFEYFNDRYGVIRFEVSNQSGRGMEISDIQFIGLVDEVEEKIDGYSNCVDWLEKRETRQCVFVTQNLGVHRFNKMETVISGEEDSWSIVW